MFHIPGCSMPEQLPCPHLFNLWPVIPVDCQSIHSLLLNPDDVLCLSIGLKLRIILFYLFYHLRTSTTLTTYHVKLPSYTNWITQTIFVFVFSFQLNKCFHFSFCKLTITIIPRREYMRKTGVAKNMQQNRINTELTEEFTAEFISVSQN